MSRGINPTNAGISPTKEISELPGNDAYMPVADYWYSHYPTDGWPLIIAYNERLPAYTAVFSARSEESVFRIAET